MAVDFSMSSFTLNLKYEMEDSQLMNFYHMNLLKLYDPINFSN